MDLCDSLFQLHYLRMTVFNHFKIFFGLRSFFQDRGENCNISAIKLLLYFLECDLRVWINNLQIPQQLLLVLLPELQLEIVVLAPNVQESLRYGLKLICLDRMLMISVLHGHRGQSRFVLLNLLLKFSTNEFIVINKLSLLGQMFLSLSL